MTVFESVCETGEENYGKPERMSDDDAQRSHRW